MKLHLCCDRNDTSFETNCICIAAKIMDYTVKDYLSPMCLIIASHCEAGECVETVRTRPEPVIEHLMKRHGQPREQQVQLTYLYEQKG